jgi:hypothetical protein
MWFRPVAQKQLPLPALNETDEDPLPLPKRTLYP